MYIYLYIDFNMHMHTQWKLNRFVLWVTSWYKYGQIQNDTVKPQYSTSVALVNRYKCKLWGCMEGGGRCW